MLDCLLTGCVTLHGVEAVCASGPWPAEWWSNNDISYLIMIGSISFTALTKTSQKTVVLHLPCIQHIECYGWNVSFPQVHMLKSQQMVYRGGAFGRWLGHEGSAITNGSRSPIKEAQENWLSFALCEGTASRYCPWARKKALNGHWICLGLGFSSLWTVRDKFLLFITH
jgi:hypothetical protein